jgi:hypothetical protein
MMRAGDTNVRRGSRGAFFRELKIGYPRSSATVCARPAVAAASVGGVLAWIGRAQGKSRD